MNQAAPALPLIQVTQISLIIPESPVMPAPLPPVVPPLRFISEFEFPSASHNCGTAASAVMTAYPLK